MALQIGVDLGGTKIEVIALARDGRVLARERTPTPAGHSGAIIEAVRDLVLAVEQGTGLRGSVGVATPGALSTATGLMKNSNSIVLNGRPLDRDLAQALARPVRLENDANCFALSEAVDGAAAGARVVFGVILGTGVGGGLVIDRRVLSGRHHIAGEWGHNALPWPQPQELPGAACYCGRRGCLESFLCGAALARDAVGDSGAPSDAQAVARASTAGEPNARAALERYVDRLARGLAGVINIIDPDAIVLGGGLSNIEALYAGVAARLPRYVFSDAIDTPILAPRHGDSSGVRGAAWLWPADEPRAGLG
jgi:fructokinase